MSSSEAGGFLEITFALGVGYMSFAAAYASSLRAPKPSASLTLEDTTISIWLPSSLHPSDRT